MARFHPYGAPQNPYGTPPQGPYTPPQQGPYGAPPQNPYGAPAYQQQGYGYPPPAAAPLPLGEAIRQLPSQYIKVLTKPSAATFAEEMGKAAWNIVWVQLIGLGIISTVLGYLVYLINPSATTSTTGSTSINPGMLQSFVLGATLGRIVLVPLGFFIGIGIFYLIAKAFGGQGTFLAQGYHLPPVLCANRHCYYCSYRDPYSWWIG